VADGVVHNDGRGPSVDFWILMMKCGCLSAPSIFYFSNSVSALDFKVLTLAVTPTPDTRKFNNISDFGARIYFYAASATAGDLSYECSRGRHRTVSAAASRRHVDTSFDSCLDLFARKSPRSWGDLAEKRALSARRFFLLIVGV
jgi:hypothetical protein